jgi:hypothetical protein
MNLRTRGTASGIQIELTPPKRSPPKRIVLHLPESRKPVGVVSGVELVLRPPQKKKWDFAAAVQLYGEHAAALFQPIPGLVEFPLDAPPAPGACQPIDLKAAANTDPFTAPFGVPKPGKLLFTGMPVGRQVVSGVPFEIIDPAKNSGRGLVVLHSPSAPRNRKWPTQVEIPLHAQGKRLFFLGNIHGWSPDDPGTGPWGAVAQYVICYTDGQRQVVPLITGRTADEWTAAPGAAEVAVGLRGDPWHLNVLGVTLRPVAVENILFCDLGTPAAPVLAGVTIEK